MSRRRRPSPRSAVEVEAPAERAVDGPERPAQGGQAARPGPGRLRRRRQAPRHGLRPLRPLAVRARAHHARSTSRRREELGGVYGTLTGEEVASLTDPFFQISTPPGAHIKDYALAVGKVRFVGEPVVAVVAETRELARDAAELVEVEYEPLDAVVDARRALDADAPVLHEDAGSNLSGRASTSGATSTARSPRRTRS